MNKAATDRAGRRARVLPTLSVFHLPFMFSVARWCGRIGFGKVLNVGNFLLLVVCFVGGIILARSTKIPAESYKLLSQIVVNISLPALAIFALHKMEIERGLWYAAAMPWAMLAISTAFFYFLGKRLGWSRESIGTLALLGGLGNTSFVGIPMVTAMFGEEAIPVAMLVDQAGSYLAIAVVGLSVASYFAGSSDYKFSLAGSLKKTAVYPPFVGMVIGLAMSWGGIDLNPAISVVVQALADTAIPLAVLAVGMQLTLSGIGERAARLAWGLGFKLILAPVITLAAFWGTGHDFGMVQKAVVVEAAMGPSIAAGVLATQQGLDSKLVSLMLGIGLPLCLITAPIIAYVMGWI
jgi:malate permease and related proteins